MRIIRRTCSESGRAPDESVARRELDSVIQAGILTLPADQRIVLVLSGCAGYGLPRDRAGDWEALGTVKSRLSRGRPAEGLFTGPSGTFAYSVPS